MKNKFEALLKAWVFGLALMLASHPPALAQSNTFTMKLSTATLNDVQHEWLKRYAAAIEKNSSGRIKTEIYPASQLGTIPRQIEGTQLGSIQVWVGPPEFLVGVDPKFELLSVPGLIPSEQAAVKVMRDPEFSQAFTNVGSNKGLVGLALCYNGPTVFAMRSPIRKLDDFKGKKIRILASPFQTEQMKRLGATGVPMSLGDVLPAIQQGTIDGAMSSAGVFQALHYYEAAKYLTEGNQSYVFSIALVSKRWFDTLPADLQDVVLKTAKQATDEVLPWSLNFVAEQRKLWTGKGGEVIELSSEDYSQLMNITAPVGPEVVKTRSDTKPLWDLLNAAVQRAKQ